MFCTSAKCKMIWKSQLNNSATLTSHIDPFRCSQMLPDRLNVKWWALRYSKTTSLVLVNVQEVVEQNTRICWKMYGGLRNATRSNYYNVQIPELFGVWAASPRRFQCILNLEPYSPGVIITMFISNSTIQLTNYLCPALLESDIVS